MSLTWVDWAAILFVCAVAACGLVDAAYDLKDAFRK